MRKPLFLMTACLTIATHAIAAPTNDVDKGDGGLDALKAHLINNRENRILNIKKSIKCLEWAADKKGLDLCSDSAMLEIQKNAKIFCQSAFDGFQETSDYKTFCGTIAGKQSNYAGMK